MWCLPARARDDLSGSWKEDYNEVVYAVEQWGSHCGEAPRSTGRAARGLSFTVEDRDRTKGVFFVRYADPSAGATSEEKKGFLDKLAFWKSDPKLEKTPQFRIRVSDAGASLSQVEVQNATGTADTSETGKRILGLIYDQLK
jgi:outer membrane protein assembly factor BamC